MKIRPDAKVPERTPKHATVADMKRIIAQQEALFQKKLDSVDASKTQTETDKWGNITNSYFDSEGNSLYARTEVNGYGGYIYGYRDENGSAVKFTDLDKDGNMDSFGINEYEGNSKNPTMFQAEDKNDDGTFDIGMPSTGPNMGKEFNLKW